MPLASADRRLTAPPHRRRRTASRIGAAAAAAGTFLAFGALAGPVFSAQAEPSGPWECSDADCVVQAFSEGQSLVLTGNVAVGQGLRLADNTTMTVDLSVHTLTVTGIKGKPGADAESAGQDGGTGAPGESGLTVGAGAVLQVTGSGTLAVAGGSGGTGGNGADGLWTGEGHTVAGAGGKGGAGGSGISNIGILTVACSADLESTGGTGGDGGNGGSEPPAGFRNSVGGRAFLMTATAQNGGLGEIGSSGANGGGQGGDPGEGGTGIANAGSIVSCGSAIGGISGHTGSVTFDSNGGEPAQVVVYAATSGIAAIVLSETDWATPILAGSTFQNWYLDADGESEVADFTELGLGTTVYAHWTSATSSSSFSPPPSSSVGFSTSSAASTTPTSSSVPAPTAATTPATTAASSTTSSRGPASLAIGVASSTPTASGGDNVTLTVNVTNPSDHDAENVQATLQLQSTMHFDGVGDGSGQGFRRASFALQDAPAAPLTWIRCAVAGADADGYGGLLTCDLSGVLKAGAAAPALLVRTTIRPGTPPTRIDVKAASQWTSNGAPGRVEAAVNLTVPEASPSLASTGVHAAWQLGLAGVLLAAGVGLMLISRRRAGGHG